MNLRTRFALSIGFLSLLCLVLPASARADLVGTTVTGSLDFDADGLNFYNPALGFVPAGYQNSPGAQNSNTVVIVGGNEFGFTDPGNNTDVTSFSSTGFTFTDTAITAGLNLNIILTLTDPAFTGVSLISSTFPGLTFAISGDQITVDIPGLNVSAGEVLTASFNVTSTSSVPEPSTYGLMLIGFGFLGFMMAMRKRLGLGIPQAS
jgi:PEP-CTERM motif